MNKKGQKCNDKKLWKAFTVIFFIFERVKIMADIGSKQSKDKPHRVGIEVVNVKMVYNYIGDNAMNHAGSNSNYPIT